VTRTASLRYWTGLLAIVGGLVRFAAPAAAQTLTLPGQVLDPDGRPVPGLEVFLHRVAQDGGRTVAADTTDASGAFQLSVDVDTAQAVFFVAARYEEQVHIGPMLRAPFPAGDYVLRLGSTPASGGTEATTRPVPAEETEGTVVLATMGALLLVAAFAVLRAFRPPAQRRLLLRLARLEESRDASGRMGPDAEVERSRILARLRFGRWT
jgi:hypothetical protein